MLVINGDDIWEGKKQEAMGGVMGEPGLDWWVRGNTSEEVTFKLSFGHNTQILNVPTHPF